MDKDEKEQLLVEENLKEEFEEAKQDTRVIDVEPVQFVYTLYLGSFLLYAEHYIFDSINKNYNFTKTETTSCYSNATNHSLITQQKIQEESSKVMLILIIGTTVPAMFSTLFLGPYCDKFGSKFPIALPLIGAAFKCVIYALVIAVEANYWWLLVGCIAEGFTGFLDALNMTVFAYSSAVSSTRKRTMKIAIVEAASFASLGIGQLITGPIINFMGYMIPFIILAVLLGLTALYVICLLPETKQNSDTLTVKLKHLFDIRNIKKCATTFTVNDSSNRRAKLLIYLVIVIIMVPMSLAKWDAQTYFLKGPPMCLSHNQVGYFTGGITFLQSFGNLGLVFFCGNLLGDLWVLAVGLTSGILHAVTFAFVENLQLLLVGEFLKQSLSKPRHYIDYMNEIMKLIFIHYITQGTDLLHPFTNSPDLPYKSFFTRFLS